MTQKPSYEELAAQNEEMREALDEWVRLAEHQELSTTSHRARTHALIAMFPADALEEHDREVREACAKALEGYAVRYVIAGDCAAIAEDMNSHAENRAASRALYEAAAAIRRGEGQA